VVIDGTLIPIGRVAVDRPFYSGMHHRHGMNLQVISAPDGEIVWVSGPLPGAVHDLTAARFWGILRELAAVGLVVSADKGYQGAGDHIRTPYKGRNKPASQKAANRAHAQLRGPGDRANAQLKTWRILRKLRCCPWKAGQLAKARRLSASASNSPACAGPAPAPSPRCAASRPAAPKTGSGPHRTTRHQPPASTDR
jgi:hypothetical protein